METLAYTAYGLSALLFGVGLLAKSVRGCAWTLAVMITGVGISADGFIWASLAQEVNNIAEVKNGLTEGAVGAFIVLVPVFIAMIRRAK